MKKFLVLFLYLFSTQSIAGSHAYSAWRQHSFRKVDTETVRVANARLSLNVTFFTDTPSTRSVEMYFDEVAEATYNLLASKIAIGPASRSGRCYNWRIVVYEMNQWNINSRNVMYWYPWRNQSQRLYGAYDSNHTTSSSTAVIVLRSDISNLERKRTLAHELTHYWYDMCVADGNPGERYAEAAESLF